MPKQSKTPRVAALQRDLPLPRTLDPLTATGVLFILVAATALITYVLLIAPGRLSAASGPPEHLRAAATRQAAEIALTPQGTALSGTSTPMPVRSAAQPTSPSLIVALSDQAAPTLSPAETWPLADHVEVRYWISIPSLGLEAPVIALAPREVDNDGLIVTRLPVPNSYSVAWDSTSAEPGFVGNTVMTGHNNLYGAVFGDLHTINYGAEVAIWSEYGVFSYYVAIIEYVEEKDQPLDVRARNAQWLNDTVDDRLTLITCWPRQQGTHRLIVVATR